MGTVYVVAYDSFYERHFDTGIRLVNKPEVIEQTLLFLHRNTTATTFHVTSTKPVLELGLLAA